MSSVLDGRPAAMSEPGRAPGASPMALIAGFASLAQRCRTTDELLVGAARVLVTALPFTHVLVLDCAGQPTSARTAAGIGWGDVPAQHLGDALMTLPCYAGSPGVGVGGPNRPDCAITELKGSDLADLSVAFAFTVPSGPFATAVSVECPLRGHVVVALLGALQPTRGLTEADRLVASAVFSILATAIEFVRRRLDYARRLKQVRRAKLAWEGTVDALPQIVCVLDLEGRVTRANRAIEAWGLGSVRSAAFGTLHDLLHPGCADRACGLAKRLKIALPQSLGSEGHRFEYADPALGRNLRIKIGLARAASGRDSRKAGSRRFAVVEDVTREHIARLKMARRHQELKRNIDHHALALTTTHEHLRAATSQLADAQVELGETRRRHRLVLDNTNAGLLMVKQGRVAYCNHRFEELLGYARGELAGAPVEDLFPPGCRPAQAVSCIDGEPLPPQEQVCQVTRKDGATVWLRHAEVGFFTENDHVRFITVINVSDQILAEREMQASRRELQRLSRALISSQEDERKRIAGELHDGLGQSLSAVKLMLQHVVSDAAGHLDDRLVAQLSACVAKIQEMTEDVRGLSMALRPAIIDSSGVVLAVTRLCRELKQSTRGLAVHLTTDIKENDVEDPLKIHLFRIAQEALNNILRHAHATNVWVQLDRCDTGLRLLIRDDGVGFDPAEMDARAAGLGLSSMKQRAKLHNGELTIDSEPGRGTTVCATWAKPLTRKGRTRASAL